MSLLNRNSSTGLNITSLHAMEVVGGMNAKMTVSPNGISQTGTVTISLSVEAENRGFWVSSWCVQSTNATAAAGVTIKLQRNTTVNSSGSQILPGALTALSPGAGSFEWVKDGDATGVYRVGQLTLGNLGGILDQVSFQAGEVGGVDEGGKMLFCQHYDRDSGKMPYQPPGQQRGIFLSATSPGSGARSIISMEMNVIWDYPKSQVTGQGQ